MNKTDKLYMENKFVVNELKKNIESIDERRVQIQEILRRNVKEFPNAVTWNNLGIYYSEYGMINKKGKEREASKLGLRYLMKAAEHSNDWRCYANVAKAVWERKKWGMEKGIEPGYIYIKKAFDLCDNICLKFDYGAYLIELRKYSEAKKVFLQMCSENKKQDIKQWCRIDPYVILAYLCVELNEISEGKRYLRSLKSKTNSIDIYDQFILEYKLGLYENALDDEMELLSGWFPSDVLLAMIADIHIMLNREYSEKVKKILEDKYSLLEIYGSNEKLREKIINSNAFGISMITGYIYIEE